MSSPVEQAQVDKVAEAISRTFCESFDYMTDEAAQRLAVAAIEALQLTEELGYKLDGDDDEGPDAWFSADEYNTSRPVTHRRLVGPWRTA